MREYSLEEIKKIIDEGDYYSLEYELWESDGIIELELGKKERFIII